MSRRSTTTATGEAERRLVQQVRKALAQDARQLDLSQQNLSKFPGELVALLDEREMPLQRLNLSNNTLQRLPEQLDRLVGLHELLLSFNQIRSFPHCPQLCNLATVYLDHNQLESLPEGIASLRGLRKLVLDNNQLSELCNGFECLRQLESLSLNTNKFEKLPQVIFQLSKLKRLLIDNNQLIELSTDIQNVNPFFQPTKSTKSIKSSLIETNFDLDFEF